MVNVESQIFLGCKLRDGSQIAAEDFDKFLNEVVVKKLESFTVLDGLGYWKGMNEHSRIIVALDAPMQAIYDIAEAYKVRFSQDAVIIGNAAMEVEKI